MNAFQKANVQHLKLKFMVTVFSVEISGQRNSVKNKHASLKVIQSEEDNNYFR